VTEVDPGTGNMNVKRAEPWINTVNPIISYLFHCNTDVTSLHSGTAIKGVLLCVSNYVTKASLKTHMIFDTIWSMFEKNSEMIGGIQSQHDKACQLMTKIAHNLSTKMEMGSSMVCIYLLGNPDHYTSHAFQPFYWKSYVNEAQKAWGEDTSADAPQKVMLVK
jgi:hypothetical protein